MSATWHVPGCEAHVCGAGRKDYCDRCDDRMTRRRAEWIDDHSCMSAPVAPSRHWTSNRIVYLVALDLDEGDVALLLRLAERLAKK